ncbi:hypothetical protein DMI70_05915 [Escherichia coli]|nr:hypothetical protein [Escherichia coli]
MPDQRDFRKARSTPRYKDEAPQAPWEGTTIPAYDGYLTTVNIPGEITDFYGKTVEVGPLANMLVKLAAGRESTQNKLNEIVADLSETDWQHAGSGAAALHAGPYYWSYCSLL